MGCISLTGSLQEKKKAAKGLLPNAAFILSLL